MSVDIVNIEEKLALFDEQWKPKIAGELNGYVEYVGVANHGLGAGYVALVGTGLTYAWTPDVQLDAAVYFGLSDDADDVSARVGLSFRI